MEYMQNQMDNLIEAGIQWKNHLDELELKYKGIPYDIRSALVDRDYKKMYGHEYTGHDGTPFYIALENAIAGQSKTVKMNIISKIVKNVLIPNEYFSLLRSGMFFEFFPQFTGELSKDREEFTKFWWERENNKGWLKLIL